MRSTPLSIGDVSGFAALILTGLAAVFILLRSYLLKRTKNLAAIRSTHLALSIAAGSLLVVHIVIQFSPPSSIGILLGYVAVGAGLAVWVTGTAFLEKLRDSLFFHGTMASLLVAIALIHAAISAVNIPFALSQTMLASSSMILMVNAIFHLKHGIGSNGRRN